MACEIGWRSADCGVPEVNFSFIGGDLLSFTDVAVHVQAYMKRSADC
jgi:hypothetical protein